MVRDGLELTAIPLVALSSQLQPYYTKGRACLRLIVCTANAEEITEFLLVFCSQEQLELWRTVFDEAKAAYSFPPALRESIGMATNKLKQLVLERATAYIAQSGNTQQIDQVTSSSSSSSSTALVPSLIPAMCILLMCVGTQGDLSPFLAIAKKLKKDGHRVRVASHALYRKLVRAEGLEFYPLAGDPKFLSQFMVVSRGQFLSPSSPLLSNLSVYLEAMKEIIESTWKACTLPDPECPEEGTFSPHAIISNPVAWGHIHCAEALSVPLHIMFPQPWVPTKAMPHPLSCLPYSSKSQWSTENLLSYSLFDRLAWLGLESTINSFRVNSLGLSPLGVGDGGFDLTNLRKVPYACMWSAALLPTPKDYPPWVDVVGSMREEEEEEESCTSNSTETSTPLPSAAPTVEKDPALRIFLADGSRPVFLGFGSMILGDAECQDVLSLFLQGAAATGTRLLVQLGWSASISAERFAALAVEAQVVAEHVREMDEEEGEIETEDEASVPGVCFTCPSTNSFPTCTSSNASFGVDGDGQGQGEGESAASHGASASSARVGSSSPPLSSWSASKDAFMIEGGCKHAWLFQHVAAVVHHGGCGTTHAGLRKGLPTWITPCFGDQYCWGACTVARGVGPEPCPVSRLTLQRVIDAIGLLRSETVQQEARKLAEKLASEDGTKGAINSFYRQLPLPKMICQVSHVRGQMRLATVHCPSCNLNFDAAISAIVHAEDGALAHHIPTLTAAKYVSWNTKASGPRGPAEGLIQGLGGLMSEVGAGIGGCLTAPVSGALSKGFAGGARGVVTGLRSLLCGPIHGSALLARTFHAGLGAAQSLPIAITLPPPTPPLSQSVTHHDVKDSEWCKVDVLVNTVEPTSDEEESAVRVAFAAALALNDLLHDLIRADELQPSASKLSWDALARVLSSDEGTGADSAVGYGLRTLSQKSQQHLDFVDLSALLSQSMHLR